MKFCVVTAVLAAIGQWVLGFATEFSDPSWPLLVWNTSIATFALGIYFTTKKFSEAAGNQVCGWWSTVCQTGHGCRWAVRRHTRANLHAKKWQIARHGSRTTTRPCVSLSG